MSDSTSHILWYPGHELLAPDMVRAEGCCVYDSSGRQYLDLECGVWCTGLGHNHPALTRAMAEQAARIAHTGFNYSSPVVEEAALDILALLGLGDGVCVFLCSGSEAVEYGVRVAQTVLERPLLMTMTDSYFGAYGSAAARKNDEWYLFDWSPCVSCDHSGPCSEDCPHWADIPFDRIGGFLFEPGSSSGLVRFPPTRLVRRIVETVRAAGGLYLVNEVTTGVGRTGRWFGHQHYDLTPDIVAMGKGIGNGYPVSVAAFAPEVRRRLGGRPVKYAQSHQNDPLGAAIVRAVIRIINDGLLVERASRTGERFARRLAAVKACTPAIKEVRWRGLMVGLELHDDSAFTLAIRTHRELARRGFLIGRRVGVSVLRIDPPLVVDSEDLDRFAAVLEEVLSTESRHVRAEP